MFLDLHLKIASKTYETLIKKMYMLLCTAKHTHPMISTILLEPDIKILLFSYLMMSECSYS